MGCRLFQYVALPKEETTEATWVADRQWPREGTVQFEAVCMAYRDDLPNVLNGLSFKAMASPVLSETGAAELCMCPLSSSALYRAQHSVQQSSVSGYSTATVGAGSTQ